MQAVSKCLLLPIDGTPEALRPVDFLTNLYPKLDSIDLILCYFMPPLPPVYGQKSLPEAMFQKKRELLKSRKEDAHVILQEAKQNLVSRGFSESSIQEHLQEKAMSVAHHACQLADIKKVDAVLIQKKTSNALESFLKDDPTNALLHHCIISPIWFIDGVVDTSSAALCLESEAASVRAADHASFMLAGLDIRLKVVHVTRSVSKTITSQAFDYSKELSAWLSSSAGQPLRPYLKETCEILNEAGFGNERVQIAIVPNKGKIASSILSYAQREGIGIIVLGHSNPEGVWSFLKKSTTKAILSDFKNMAVWVNQ